MKGEYAALKSLESHQGFAVLQALWASQGGRIMEAMQKAAARGQESAWRYYAGQLKGFDLAITQLERALAQMDREEQNKEEQKTADQLLKEIKGGE